MLLTYSTNTETNNHNTTAHLRLTFSGSSSGYYIFHDDNQPSRITRHTLCLRIMREIIPAVGFAWRSKQHLQRPDADIGRDAIREGRHSIVSVAAYMRLPSPLNNRRNGDKLYSEMPSIQHQSRATLSATLRFCRLNRQLCMDATGAQTVHCRNRRTLDNLANLTYLSLLPSPLTRHVR